MLGIVRALIEDTDNYNEIAVKTTCIKKEISVGNREKCFADAEFT